MNHLWKMGSNDRGSIVVVEKMKYKYFKQGMKDGIPIALGYFAVSFTFGMAAVTGGLTVGQAVLISMTNVTSAGQFAGLGIILSMGTYLEIAMTQLIINLRYCLMSFSLSQKLEKSRNPLHRFLVAFGVTDEIFGISASQSGKVSPYYNYGAMSVALPGWIIGTLAGAVLGNILPDAVTSALGVAIYGMFLAIIIPPAKEDSAVLKVVVAAMAISFLFGVLPGLNRISSGFVIIITTLLVAGLAAYFFPIEEKTEEQKETPNYGA